MNSSWTGDDCICPTPLSVDLQPPTTRYDPKYFTNENGDHYTWHQDPIKEQTDICRKLTTAILLSDPTTYEGGVFEFYGGDSTTIPIVNQGAVMVFDSLDWHRVTPVTSGRRFSLIQWATGPKFR